MKKLLTLLFTLTISVMSFGVTTYTWTGTSGNNWNDAGNWTPYGIPGTTVGVYDDVIIDIGGTITINIDVQPINLGNMTLNDTYVNFYGTTDGNLIHFYSDGVFTVGHTKDVYVDYTSTLNCNMSNHRVQIICHPGIRFLIGSTKSGGVYYDGHFYPAIYSPCEAEKGFRLMAGLNAAASPTLCHAELVEQNHSSSPVPGLGLTGIRGWVDYQFDIVTLKPHYIGVPVANDPSLKTGGLNICRKSNCLCTFDGDYFRKFTNGNSGGWGSWMGNYPDCNVAALDVEVGRGYEVFPLIDQNKIYGTFNNAPYWEGTGGSSTPIVFPMDITQKGWNFLSNPFPSGLKFTANSGGTPAGWDWDKIHIADWVAYFDNSYGAYRYYNVGDAGLSSPLSTTDIIPRGQGFFVYIFKVTGGAVTPLSVTNNARNFETAQSIFKPSTDGSEDLNNLFRVTLSNNSKDIDEVLIRMHDVNATANFDGESDFQKLFVNSADRSELYSTTNDKVNVVMNSMAPAAGTIAVPVSLNVGPTDTYTLTVTQNTFSAKTGILLRDNKNNTTTDLKTNPDYTFSATAGDDPARFTITFTDVLNGIGTLTNNNFGIYSYGNSIYIQNTTKNVNGSVTVYDMIGKQVYQGSLSNDLITKINTTFNQGFYIVSVKNADGISTQKVYIN